MEVVKQSLAALETDTTRRAFFLTKLSASGRGESDPASSNATAEENRRVVFKIRVKSDRTQTDLTRALDQRAMPTQVRPGY